MGHGTWHSPQSGTNRPRAKRGKAIIIARYRFDLVFADNFANGIGSLLNRCRDTRFGRESERGERRLFRLVRRRDERRGDGSRDNRCGRVRRRWRSDGKRSRRRQRRPPEPDQTRQATRRFASAASESQLVRPPRPAVLPHLRVPLTRGAADHRLVLIAPAVVDDNGPHPTSPPASRKLAATRVQRHTGAFSRAHSSARTILTNDFSTVVWKRERSRGKGSEHEFAFVKKKKKNSGVFTGISLRGEGQGLRKKKKTSLSLSLRSKNRYYRISFFFFNAHTVYVKKKKEFPFNFHAFTISL